jgi:hypothetical protein
MRGFEKSFFLLPRTSIECAKAVMLQCESLPDLIFTYPSLLRTALFA